MLTGSLVAIVTPFYEDGTVDYDQLKQLIDWHIESGTDGIVIAGTTGESATLTMDEQIKSISVAVEHAASRIKIIAGTGANNTREAIHLSQEAERVGADMGLSVVPYYNKPSQEGIYQHFKSIAAASKLPIMLYNVPSRTVADISNETTLRLAQIENIIGIKDATGDLGRACELIKKAPKDFLIYSGDDSSALAFLLCGGHGIISVTANVAPKLFADLCHQALAGNILEARKTNDKLQKLHTTLFCEPSPAPTKWALAQLNKIRAISRLPIIELSESGQAQMREALQEAGLL